MGETMKEIRISRSVIIAFLLISTSAYARSGEDITVAQARKDYEEALKSKDIGRINAMKVELAFQLNKEKQNQEERTSKKDESRRSNQAGYSAAKQ
jgi:hypothetical protein